MKKIIGLILILIGFFTVTRVVEGYTIPSFPTCEAPQGDLKIRYEQGIHGIPGRSEIFQGSDAVYTVSDITLTQCFCPVNGSTGIQTNWWKVSTLEEGMVDPLQKEGWIYIPDGSLWGLETSNYFAKNIEYVCRPSGNGSNNPSSLSVGGGALKATGAVMGLASTGNAKLIAGSLLVGVLLIIVGVLIPKVRKTQE